MNNNRQSNGIKKSSRILASILALLMITALILPMGAKASETADGSASGASQAVAEEHTEKEEEQDSSDSDAKKEEEEKAEAAETEEKEQKSDSSSDTVSEDSSDSGSESGIEKDESKEESGDESAQKSKEEAGGSDQTSGKGASDAEEDKDAGKSSNTDQRDSEKTDSGNKSGKTDAAQEKDAASGKSVEAGTDAGTSEETSEQVTAVVENDETTITFQTEEVTVIADKKAFDTEVTMKVKKVTDPAQLLKMVTALQSEGGSYTVKAYNVSFYDENGNEVEPKIPVQVNVNTRVSSPRKTKVVHVKDDDKTEILEADIDRSGASFELGSFSDIGVATEGKAKVPGSSFDLYLGDELTTEYEVDDLPAGPISEKDLPAVEGYRYENATVGDDQVEEIGTITDEDGNVYVYYTTRDENGTIKAEILGDGRIRINLVETDQDTTYDLEVDGTRVCVEAPADAFDEGTYKEIQTIDLDDTQTTQVKKQAAQVLGEEAQMKIQAVDITFYDKDGKEVQPAKKSKWRLLHPRQWKETSVSSISAILSAGLTHRSVMMEIYILARTACLSMLLLDLIQWNIV